MGKVLQGITNTLKKIKKKKKNVSPIDRKYKKEPNGNDKTENCNNWNKKGLKNSVNMTEENVSNSEGKTEITQAKKIRDIGEKNKNKNKNLTNKTSENLQDNYEIFNICITE